MDKSKTNNNFETFKLGCAILLSFPVLFFGIISFIAIPKFIEINKKAKEITALCEMKDTEDVQR